jgi:hypothetical protein
MGLFRRGGQIGPELSRPLILGFSRGVSWAYGLRGSVRVDALLLVPRLADLAGSAWLVIRRRLVAGCGPGCLDQSVRWAHESTGAVMRFEPMPLDEIRAFLEVIGEKRVPAISVILTDGTMLTGRFRHYPDRSVPLILEAETDGSGARVEIPTDRIAGILEQNPIGAKELDPTLLSSPAEQAGLKGEYWVTSYLRQVVSEWTQAEVIHYDTDTMLYLDAEAISARSGGINNIGGGFIVSASMGWESKLVSRAARRLKRNVVEIGEHCAAWHADVTVIGYVEFYDDFGVQPSPEGGPVLEVEGALWNAAIVWRAPPGERQVDNRWALCYFRKDRLGLGPRSWERIDQPVRVYGDKQPHQQTLDLGVAPCYLKARAAACFPTDRLCLRVCPTVSYESELDCVRCGARTERGRRLSRGRIRRWPRRWHPGPSARPAAPRSVRSASLRAATPPRPGLPRAAATASVSARRAAGRRRVSAPGRRPRPGRR